MKSLKTSSLAGLQILLISFPFFAFSSPFTSPDKIGSGGGVWLCEGPSNEVFDLMFMDIFEARREYQLTVPELNEELLVTVQKQKTWLQQNLPSYVKMNEHILYVEKNITWIDDIINSIPDAANKLTPHPSLCKQGTWKPVQLVNFTDDFRILVRRELFESPLLSNMERAAVYIHEGVYSFLRSEYGDTTSVRTRAIVGFLFSDLPDAEKVLRIQKVLGQGSTPSPAQPVSGGYICGIKPDTFSALYTFEAKTEEEARKGTLKACTDGETPQIPGLPDIPGFPMTIPGFPGFPGFPGGGDGSGDAGGYGPAMGCKAVKVSCEQILTAEKTKTCRIRDFFDKEMYVGRGRTTLEARKEVMTQCMAGVGQEHECYRGERISCN